MSDNRNNNKTKDNGGQIKMDLAGGRDAVKKSASKMTSNKRKAIRNRRAGIAAVLCFMAAIAIVGTYTLRDYQSVKKQQEELAQAKEDIRSEDITESQETGGAAEKSAEIVFPTVDKPADKTDTDTDDNSNAKSSENMTDSSTDSSTGAGEANSFTSESTLLWPVNGAVLMSFSMDKTVYFRTLDQYKYNPAIIISATEGEEALCGAPGTVKSIETTAQTGTTVDIDLGGGYEAMYGQLKDVPVQVGDHVEAKTVLGTVSQPTKYYSTEGCNIYLEMRKDGRPINPADYLSED